MNELANLHEQITEMLNGFDGDYQIMEQEVDVDVQMEYYELAEEVVMDFDESNIEAYENLIQNKGGDIKAIKEALIKLSKSCDIKAYRLLEKIDKEFAGEDAIKPWLIMALQESRMLLQSELLEENQVFISTGLGGKGTSLRYFLIINTQKNVDFTDFQQNIVQNEFKYTLNKNNAVLEAIEFDRYYATMKVLIPLEVEISGMLNDLINECNQYGDYLSENYLITNVRILDKEEIEEALTAEKSSSEEIE